MPLRPILSLTGSAQHELAKYFCFLLQPVLTFYSSNCTRDFFTVADFIITSYLEVSCDSLCSFGISSLFTNILLTDTIQICAIVLYNLEHPLAQFVRQIFANLMEMISSSVEFSFNDIMHRQIDGAPWDHPLPIFSLATMN